MMIQLRVRREAMVLELLCRVRIRRRLEDAFRSDDERSAFGGTHRLDRLAGCLDRKILYSVPSAITLRSPSDSFFGGSVADCTCMMFCLARFS